MKKSLLMVLATTAVLAAVMVGLTVRQREAAAYSPPPAPSITIEYVTLFDYEDNEDDTDGNAWGSVYFPIAWRSGTNAVSLWGDCLDWHEEDSGVQGYGDRTWSGDKRVHVFVYVQLVSGGEVVGIPMYATLSETNEAIWTISEYEISANIPSTWCFISATVRMQQKQNLPNNVTNWETIAGPIEVEAVYYEDPQ